jgi:hypothetical protein
MRCVRGCRLGSGLTQKSDIYGWAAGKSVGAIGVGDALQTLDVAGAREQRVDFVL